MQAIIKAALVAVSLLASWPVAARPIDDAIAAYNRGDYATALRVFRPLADQGDSDAQFYLANMYAEGQGVPRNYDAALRLFLALAEKGDPEAQTNLGIMYLNGEGVPKNYSAAVMWYRLAAAQGSATAQVGLGNAYLAGRGVPKDDVLAYMWFNLAAAKGNTMAAKAGAKNRDLVAARMTQVQIAEAQRLTREWKPGN